MRALCWGENRWGVRRLLTHIGKLPRDSAYVRSLSGPAAYWDEHAELLASLIDATERNTYYLLKVNGNDAPEPSVWPRPGAEPATPKTVSLAEWASTI